MLMKSIRFLLLLSIVFVALGTSAQGVLSIDPNDLNSSVLPDTVAYGSNSGNISVWVRNTDSVTFTGQISIHYTIDYSTTDTVYTTSDSVSGIGYSQEADTIQAHDSIQKNLRFYFTGPKFTPSIGLPSGVVIWPVASGAITLDSVSRLIYIKDTTSTGIQNSDVKKLKVYMDGNELLIKSDAENMPTRVRIYDALGDLMLQQDALLSGVISMNQYAQGVYFAEITLTDNSRLVYKVIKQ